MIRLMVMAWVDCVAGIRLWYQSDAAGLPVYVLTVVLLLVEAAGHNLLLLFRSGCMTKV